MGESHAKWERWRVRSGRVFLALTMVLTTLVSSASAGPAFDELPADPRPSQTTRSNHYVISNEYRHFLFKEALDDVGGVFIGVGSDQVYLMAGWARPKVLVPMDFDQFIVDLHAIYRLAFLNAKSPDAFFDLWKDSKALKRLIQTEAPADMKRTLLKILKFGRQSIVYRLKKIKRTYTKLGVGTFLTEQAQYDVIRDLYLAGKVYPTRGDLTQTRTLRAIGAAAKAADLHIGAIYLSNAEQYFQFRQAYRANIQALPANEHSLVLRTLPDGAKQYTYYIQRLGLFQTWLKTSTIKKLLLMLDTRQAVPRTQGRLFQLLSPPPAKWLHKAGPSGPGSTP